MSPTRFKRVRRRSEQGQAAVEFVLAFTFIAGLACVLFQALHFELDVFNKSLEARRDLFRQARQNEADTKLSQISNTIQGKDLSDVTSFRVLWQPTGEIGSLHFGPRQYRMLRGTKYSDPLESLHSAFVFAGILIVDHEEDAAGNIGSFFSALSF
ncbi:MAG TPA: hypothetical protein VHL58_08905 [Thermoanaerobaculia bacterium]|nr:hypothetical protein [Thermoanaerobaculia bacterium]